MITNELSVQLCERTVETPPPPRSLGPVHVMCALSFPILVYGRHDNEQRKAHLRRRRVYAPDRKLSRNRFDPSFHCRGDTQKRKYRGKSPVKSYHLKSNSRKDTVYLKNLFTAPWRWPFLLILLKKLCEPGELTIQKYYTTSNTHTREAGVGDDFPFMTNSTHFIVYSPGHRKDEKDKRGE